MRAETCALHTVSFALDFSRVYFELVKLSLTARLYSLLRVNFLCGKSEGFILSFESKSGGGDGDDDRGRQFHEVDILGLPLSLHPPNLS